MLRIIRSNKFKTDIKKIQKKAAILELKKVIIALANQEVLDVKYRAHQLGGNYSGYMECHVKPDLLLIYKHSLDELYLYLARVGSHSKLF